MINQSSSTAPLTSWRFGSFGHRLVALAKPRNEDLRAKMYVFTALTETWSSCQWWASKVQHSNEISFFSYVLAKQASSGWSSLLFLSCEGHSVPASAEPTAPGARIYKALVRRDDWSNSQRSSWKESSREVQVRSIYIYIHWESHLCTISFVPVHASNAGHILY